jgi:hypothetical protein
LENSHIGCGGLQSRQTDILERTENTCRRKQNTVDSG